MEFGIVAAVNRHGGIGAGGRIPWNCPADMTHFRALTMGGIVIMGCITWESLGERTLDGRHIIVVSSRGGVCTDDVTHVCGLNEALAAAKTKYDDEPTKYTHAWVAGGRALYEEALLHPLCMRAVITEIDDESACDVYFPFSRLAQHWCVVHRVDDPLSVVHYRPINRRDETQYLDIMQRLHAERSIPTRTGVPARSMFGVHLRFQLVDGVVPLLTTKNVPVRIVYAELLWFLRGQTNIAALHANNVHIWDGNATREYLDSRGLSYYPEGELGPIYGAQWRRWGGVFDQIEGLITGLRSDPFGRRHVVSAWNVADLSKMALPPCHCLFQFVVHGDAEGRPAALSCILHQRSGDYFLGVPFNIASYSILTHMVGHLVGLPAREFVLNIADCHLYSNHEDAALTQRARSPRGPPRIHFTKQHTSIDDFDESSVVIVGYYPHATISAPMCV